MVFDSGNELNGDGHQDKRNELDHKAAAGEKCAEVGPVAEEQVQAEQEEKEGVAFEPAGQGVDRHKEGGVDPEGTEGILFRVNRGRVWARPPWGSGRYRR